jgi:hypothetical protein
MLFAIAVKMRPNQKFMNGGWASRAKRVDGIKSSWVENLRHRGAVAGCEHGRLVTKIQRQWHEVIRPFQGINA